MKKKDLQEYKAGKLLMPSVVDGKLQQASSSSYLHAVVMVALV